MAQKVHEKPDTKGPYKGHLGHKGDIKATMGTFFNRVINVPNVPGSDSKIGKETRHKPAKPVTKAKGARNAKIKNDVFLPIFEEQQSFFIVTFKASLVEGGILEEGAQKGVQKSTQKSIQKTSDMILAILAENPSATTAQMAEELGIHPSAVKKHLRNLKKQVRLRRIGPDKGGRWEVMS